MLGKFDHILDKDVVGIKGQKLADLIAAFTLANAPLPMAKDRKMADDKRKLSLISINLVIGLSRTLRK